jgi:Cys-tRNA(Pro)/Cys-tRNA(Cys) deacylase
MGHRQAGSLCCEDAMGRSTRATKALEQAGVSFTAVTYEYDPDAERVGLQAAAALGADPGRVLKSLMVVVDGRPTCAILPSDCELSLKSLAAVLGCKAAAMMKPDDAERVSGYKVGGISPFGQTRLAHVVFEVAATEHQRVFINGGQRGLQIELSPGDAIRVLQARVAPILAK